MYKYLFTVVLFLGAVVQAGEELHVIYTYDHENVGKIIQVFSANTGIKIKSEYMEQSALKIRMMAMTESRWAPDAVIIPADHLGLHSFVKYSEVDPRLFKANIPERIWGSSISDGKFYGAPLIQGNHLILYYNKSLVKEPARDWQEMLAQKAALEAKGIALIAWPYYEPFYFLPFFTAFGGWPLNNGKAELNTPAMITALDFYKSLLANDLIDPDCKYQCAPELFKAGKIAYTIKGEWEGADFFRILGDKLGVSAIPMANGKKILPAFSTYTIAFPYDSLKGKNRAQLIQLVNYLQSTKVQQQFSEQIGAIPVEATAFTTTQKNAPNYLKQTLTLMADARPLPADQAMSFIWEAMRKGLVNLQEKSQDSKNTALYMQQLAERYLRNAQHQTQPDSQKQAEK